MGLKRTIIAIKWFPSHVINLLTLRLRKINCGKRLSTHGTLFVRGTGTITIGENVSITSCRETNPIGGDVKTILFAKNNATITIGDNTGISNSALVAVDSIAIGNNVLIGGNCKIYDNDFHSLDFNERMGTVDLGVKHAPVVIKDGAFIGAHTIVLKGVTIGERSIVGAGSVVTRSIPDYEIWAGNPAKFIKKVE